jgi:hypothetical protein
MRSAPDAVSPPFRRRRIAFNKSLQATVARGVRLISLRRSLTPVPLGLFRGVENDRYNVTY